MPRKVSRRSVLAGASAAGLIRPASAALLRRGGGGGTGGPPPTPGITIMGQSSPLSIMAGSVVTAEINGAPGNSNDEVALVSYPGDGFIATLNLLQSFSNG